jgi:hypothetical protein
MMVVVSATSSPRSSASHSWFWCLRFILLVYDADFAVLLLGGDFTKPTSMRNNCAFHRLSATKSFKTHNQP